MVLSNMYANSINMPLYTDEELEKLDRRIMAGDYSARKEYILGNLRLVVNIAKRYKTRFLDIEDLVQAGNLGLIRASEEYDPTKENKFSTYAVYWIRQSIDQEIKKYEDIVRLSFNKQGTIRKLRNAANEFTAKNSKSPTIEELAAQTGLSKDDIKELSWLNKKVLSLNEAIDDQGTERQCLVPDIMDVEETCIDSEAIKQALSTINGRDLEIILYRFGFYDGKPKTLEETAKYIGGITHERVRQIEKRVLNKLRENIMGIAPKKK